MIAVLPFFHIYGMVVIMMLGLAGGGTIVVMPRFDMAEFLGLVQKHKATVLPLVPPIVLGPGEAPHGGAVRPLERAARLLRRGAARRGHGARAQREARLPGRAGLRHDRGEPGDASEPHANAPFRPGSAGRIVPNTR